MQEGIAERILSSRKKLAFNAAAPALAGLPTKRLTQALDKLSFKGVWGEKISKLLASRIESLTLPTKEHASVLRRIKKHTAKDV